jgi:HAD superfamily hydrolase (TIGR01450 family)
MGYFTTKFTLLMALATPQSIASFASPRANARRFAMKAVQSSSKNEVSSSSTTTMKHIKGIQSISASYDTFLLDMWGVMHNGSKPYEGVIDTIRQLKTQGKKMIILSNSSKRVDNAKRMLKKLGFDESDFDQIITSGEISYRMLCGDDTLQCSNWDVLTNLIQQEKNKVFVFGSGDGDEDYVESSGWSLAPIEEADLIIARGTFTINSGDGSAVSKKDNEDEYFNILNRSLAMAAERNVPMLVTNPDKVRPEKGLPPMPGAIGDSYAKVLGDASETLVKRIGKPYPEVYELALLGCEDSRTAVMIGDALETDVTGGTRFKCSTAWIVNDGVHSPFVSELGEGHFEKGTNMVLESFNNDKGYEGDDRLSPTYISKHFRW